MLPHFPTFKKIEIEDKEFIRSFCSQFPPYSDFNFTSLFSWNTDSATEWCMLGNSLILKIPDYLTGEPVFSFLGQERAIETAHELLKMTDSLKLIPETSAEELGMNGFVVEEDRDNFDYLFLTPMLAKPSGSTKRNLINRFLNSHSKTLQYRMHNQIPTGLKEEIAGLFNSWERTKEKNSEETQYEFSALNSILNHFDSLEVHLFEVRTDGRLIGFSIFEFLTEGYSVVHFEKADLGVEGAAQFLQRETAFQLLKKGSGCVNYEQDLGIGGLRKSKMMAHPISFLKKYTVRMKKASE